MIRAAAAAGLIRIRKQQNRGNPGLVPSTILFGRILDGDAGFYGQSRHILGGKWALKLGKREHEVNLIGMKLVVEIQSRNEFIVTEGIRIAEEDRRIGGIIRILLGFQNLRNEYGKRVLVKLAVN